jgi:hypothetical protein
VKRLGTGGGFTTYTSIKGNGEGGVVPARARVGIFLGVRFVTVYEPFSRSRRQMSEAWEDAMNNSSMFTADRGTHLKIVVVSLICATVVAGIGIAARVSAPNGRMDAGVITVGKPVTASTTDGTSIR